MEEVREQEMNLTGGENVSELTKAVDTVSQSDVGQEAVPADKGQKAEDSVSEGLLGKIRALLGTERAGKTDEKADKVTVGKPNGKDAGNTREGTDGTAYGNTGHTVLAEADKKASANANERVLSEAGQMAPAKAGQTVTAYEAAKAGEKLSEETLSEPVYTAKDLEAAKQAAVEELLARQKEEARKASLTPEEAAAEEQAEMKRINEELSGRIKRMELEQKAAKGLAKRKLPAELADFLNYSDEKAMDDSLEKLGRIFHAGLEAGIQERLKGSTPKGLGAAANLEKGIIGAEIAKKIRGGM